MNYHLFEVYGIEAEYVIVDSESLKVLPIADQILKFFNKNQLKNEVQLDKNISISNEIVSTVIELKTKNPKESLFLDKEFHSGILKINSFLENLGAVLMPTGMHPFLDPKKEMYLWQYDNQEIYNCYHEIFNCKGHGWCNLQSIHINLPFYGNNEFFLLHNAIRIILPLIPALSGSSLFVEKKKFLLDSRLYFYEKNQKKIPSITGIVIPEYIETIEEYREKILSPMYKDIEKYDPKKILQEEWLNSRGAIARFERSAIEIRLMDVQESPIMDFTLINLFKGMIQYLVHNHYKENFELEVLYKIYKESLKNGTNTKLPETYLKIWNIKKNQMLIKDFIPLVLEKIPYPNHYLAYLQMILKKGNLSERILKYLKANKKRIDQKNIAQVYKKLINNLKENSFFDI